MNKLTSATVWLLVLMLSGLSGCSEPVQKGMEKKENAPPIKGLTLAKVMESDLPDQLEVVGTVKARSSAVVAARIAGVVTSLAVKEGDRVARGKLLLTLAADESAAGAAAATAAVQEARQGVDEALARQKLADTTFERFQRLYNEQAVTRQEMDMRQTDKELAARGQHAHVRVADARCALGVVAQRRGLHHAPAGIQLGLAVGQHGLHQLEVADALAELLALARVGHRLVEDALRHAAGDRRDVQAAAVEHLHRGLEAQPGLATDDVRGRNMHVVEDHVAGLGAALAHLLVLLAELDAGQVGESAPEALRVLCRVRVATTDRRREHHRHSDVAARFEVDLRHVVVDLVHAGAEEIDEQSFLKTRVLIDKNPGSAFGFQAL